MGFVKICPSCGHKCAVSAFSCPVDGVDLINVDPAVETDTAMVPPAKQPEPAQTWVCPGCGYPNNPASEHECVICQKERFANVKLPPKPGGARDPNSMVIESSGPSGTDATRLEEEHSTATTIEPSFLIRFPFGEVPLQGILRVGRDPLFSPLADKVSGYGTVGRRHAELSCMGGVLTVTDLASTNGVYVNGAPIPANRATPLKEGDAVSFSTKLIANIGKPRM